MLAIVARFLRAKSTYARLDHIRRRIEARSLLRLLIVSRPFDICIVTGIFPPDTGGPAKFAEAFLNWGKLTGKRVAVISLTNQEDQIKNVPNSRITLISRQRRFVSRFVRSVLAIRSMMNQGVPILANGMFLETLIARYLGVPFLKYSTKIPGDIVWERARNSGVTRLGIDEFQTAKLSLRYRIFRMLFSVSLRKSTSVVVPSSHLRKLAQTWGVRENNVNLIFNSIDLEHFALNKNCGAEFDVMTVCRLVKWKGVEELVHACSELDLALAIIGDGPERESLERLSVELNASVTFFGEVDQSQLPELLTRASAFVLNSSFEATSYALIEARAIGLFSIARSNTGSEEIITHNLDGLLCGPETMNLHEALSVYKKDKAFVSKCVKHARIDCETRFNQSSNFERIYNLVQTSRGFHQ